MFWGMHLLIVWASFFLVPGMRILPTWRTYRQSIAITLARSVSAYLFNVAAETNYGYLNELALARTLIRRRDRTTGCLVPRYDRR